jgi:recombination protein RecA
MAKEAQLLTLEEIDKQIKTEYKEDGDPNIIPRPSFYNTGVPSIDFAFGGGVEGEYGGFPAGHITEVFGPTGVGKTTLVYRAIAHNQKVNPDKINIILDYEHTTDPKYIKACGVKFDKSTLRIFRPTTMEQGFEYLLMYMQTGKLGIFCVDSLAAMNPGADLIKQEKDMAAAQMASKARLLSQILRNLVPKLAKTDATLIFINHEIANISINPYSGGYQPPTITPGGNALKYYTSMRIQLAYKGAITEESKALDGTDIKIGVGKKISAFVEKFKFGAPGQRVEYMIRSNEGIDTLTPLIGVSEELGFIKKDKRTYVVTVVGHEPVRAVGADALREALKANPGLVDALTTAVGGTKIETSTLPTALTLESDVWESQ